MRASLFATFAPNDPSSSTAAVAPYVCANKSLHSLVIIIVIIIARA